MRITIVIFLAFLVSCGSGTTHQNTIKVACAANMLLAMDSIVIIFEKDHGIHCDITSGSSGMLTSQIENGAPYDMFVSANMNYPETIYNNGNGSEPIIYAKGRLLFVVNNQTNYTKIEEVFQDPKIKRIGIADDRTAPYGMAASDYLDAIDKKKDLEKMLVTGESVGQVNQYLTTGAVDAAFTSYSFKVKNENKYSFFEVDSTYFDPIYQAAMILDHGNKQNADACNQLLKFFTSEKCKGILNYYGYITE